MAKNRGRRVVEGLHKNRFLVIENIMLGEREFVNLRIIERTCNGEQQVKYMRFSLDVAKQVSNALADHLAGVGIPVVETTPAVIADDES